MPIAVGSHSPGAVELIFDLKFLLFKVLHLQDQPLVPGLQLPVQFLDVVSLEPKFFVFAAQHSDLFLQFRNALIFGFEVLQHFGLEGTELISIVFDECFHLCKLVVEFAVLVDEDFLYSLSFLIVFQGCYSFDEPAVGLG